MEIIFMFFAVFSHCSGSTAWDLEEALNKYNEELRVIQHEEAQIAWNISLGEDPNAWELNKRISIEKNSWRNKWCQNLLMLRYQPGANVTAEESRMIYLACRGPRFTSYQLNSVITVLTKMEEIYSTTEVFSLKMEPDLNKLMETSRDDSLLRTAWTQWHQKVGIQMRPLYTRLVQKLNIGARNAGFPDFGDLWRGEMEMEDLKGKAFRLYEHVLPLYKLLHAYVRLKLGHFYGSLDVHQRTIPAHLLGNMWAQKWDSLMDIVYNNNGEGQIGRGKTNPLVQEIVSSKMKNASAMDLVHSAENLYISMGFPHLPASFYEKSYFTQDSKLPLKNCHGTAANMFRESQPTNRTSEDGDYRVMMCIGDQLTDEDLVTVTHEMGHVYYFMAYSHLKPIFQDGANTAFHESVGDCLTYGLKSAHQDDDGGIENLLKIGLARLPQIGFGLVMDLWRWYIFENEDKPETWNEHWWKLHEELLGISPPTGYNTEGLDATGKYHIVQNIPYIRYFLSSFLQLQFFEALCRHGGKEELRDLHECQLRGNEKAGTRLWKMMEKGSSQHWSQTLLEMTGSEEIEARPLLRYFQPLKTWLEGQVAANDLNVGW